jgi:hypothetical protein
LHTLFDWVSIDGYCSFGNEKRTFIGFVLVILFYFPHFSLLLNADVENDCHCWEAATFFPSHFCPSFNSINNNLFVSLSWHEAVVLVTSVIEWERERNENSYITTKKCGFHLPEWWGKQQKDIGIDMLKAAETPVIRTKDERFDFLRFNNSKFN